MLQQPAVSSHRNRSDRIDSLSSVLAFDWGILARTRVTAVAVRRFRMSRA
jgi:hypothetical protein